MATETKNLNKLTKNLGKYLDQDQLEQVKKAYFFAANAHSGQFRVSGDPYVSHPLAVAEILGKLKMDQDCLSAAMLHDVIEDSGIPKTFLKKEFKQNEHFSIFHLNTHSLHFHKHDLEILLDALKFEFDIEI